MIAPHCIVVLSYFMSVTICSILRPLLINVEILGSSLNIVTDVPLIKKKTLITVVSALHVKLATSPAVILSGSGVSRNTEKE